MTFFAVLLERGKERARRLWGLSVEVGIVKADLETERDDLIDFDKQIFPDESWIDCLEQEWFQDILEAWWVFVGDVRAGCVVFVRGINVNKAGFSIRNKRYLWIASTGLLPEFRGRGIGKTLKAWQIAYAREEGFQKLVTQCRVSNARMIGINKRFGFQERRIYPGSYQNPEEDGVVMELKLR